MANRIPKEWRIQNTSALPIKERLLQIRGIAPEHQDNFFQPQLSHLHDPFLFNDMETAVERIQQAILDQERIIIFGDYDVDGVTGAAILVRTLIKLKAHVSYRLPHRVEDGYGLKNYLVDEIASTGAKLLITVDNGISAHNEVAYARTKGLDVIITDHHSIPTDLPEAIATLHPKVEGEQYPFKDLCGSGVAFMLAACLLYSNFSRSEADEFLMNMLDIVMLGTIADCVPLVGDNRVLVKFGLERLARTVHPGLSHLMQIAQVDPAKIDTHTVEYVIAPRMNAGGRMDTAIDALHLLLFADDKSKLVAQKLHELNIQRQLETEKILEEAEAKLAREGVPGIVIIEGDWHIGIIGIVAARLAERYGVPAIVLGKKDKEYVASCRWEGRTNIIATLRHFSRYFIRYGGHEAAAGFSILAEQYPLFKQELAEFIALQQNALGPILTIDTLLKTEDITWDLYDFVNLLAPYGERNERPVFALEHARIKEKRTVGKNNNHLKLLLESEGVLFDSIGFSLAEQGGTLHTDQPVDVACELEKNEFNGNTKLNLIVRDIRPAK